MGRLNPDLRILGVLATMYDPRTLHSREVLETGCPRRLFEA